MQSLLVPAGVVMFTLCMLAVAGVGTSTGIRTPDEVIVLENLDELSALVFDPKRQSLFGATDGGSLVEMDLEGQILHRRALGPLDLEGLARKAGGLLLLLARRPASILRVKPEGFEVQGRLPLPQITRHPRDSYAGVACQTGKEKLLLLNQARPAALIPLDSASGTLGKPRPLPLRSANDLLLSPDSRQIVLLSRRRGLRLFSVSGRPLGPWHPLRARHAEGLCLVPGRGLYVATDEFPSRVLRFRNLDSWPALRAFLTRVK